jgi:hypothetical protein
MLVAISGSQGSGKSTILNRLKEKGFNILERKISRSILQDWNVTLEEVNSNYELGMKFQEETFQRKQQDEIEKAYDPKVLYFTERSHADFFAYAVVNFGKLNQYADWLQDYYLRCMQAQTMYKHCWYLKAGNFAVVGDGVRAVNRHYSTMVDLAMYEFTEQMTPTGRLSVVNTPVLDERVAMIQTHTPVLCGLGGL